MKYLKFILVATLIFTACKNEKKNNLQNKTYVSFGKQITAENVISAKEMGEKFENLKSGDTIDVKFSSIVKDVCKKKGCWVKVGLDEDKSSLVRFKDYGFFMPMNSEGSSIIMNGKAYISTITVKQLQHYAKDAGKSEEEIAKITEPRVTLAFLADGVLLEKINEK